MPPRLAFALALAVALSLSGCFTSRYVGQAGFGQLELWTGARSVEDVLADPDTDPRTHALLEEARSILTFASRNGLSTHGNYRRYVDIDRQAVVWFVTASKPLAFEPKLWRFPLVGSFPYLGWFDPAAALRFRAELEAGGWEVYVRPVRAFSTGGWFHDPILSSMLLPTDDAIRYLANTLIHELVHANVLVEDQATFNESVASFIGDELAASYLAERFGADSAELAAYRAELADDRADGERMARAYAELDALYQSSASDADKRAGKARILGALRDELSLARAPNNALLQQFKTYNSGFAELAALFVTCGRSWPRLIAAVKSATPRAFAAEQQDDLAAVIPRLAERCRAR